MTDPTDGILLRIHPYGLGHDATEEYGSLTGELAHHIPWLDSVNSTTRVKT